MHCRKTKTNMSKNFRDISIGAVASILAGAYYLYGSSDNAAKKKQLKGWALKMQGEIMERLEKAKEITEPKYNEIVEAVSKKYKHIEKKEVGELVDSLKKTWKKMKIEVNAEVAKRQAQIEKENAASSKSTKKARTNKKTKSAVKANIKKVTTKKKPTKKASSSKIQTPVVEENNDSVNSEDIKS